MVKTDKNVAEDILMWQIITFSYMSTFSLHHRHLIILQLNQVAPNKRLTYFYSSYIE